MSFLVPLLQCWSIILYVLWFSRSSPSDEGNRGDTPPPPLHLQIKSSRDSPPAGVLGWQSLHNPQPTNKIFNLATPPPSNKIFNRFPSCRDIRLAVSTKWGPNSTILARKIMLHINLRLINARQNLKSGTKINFMN